MRFSIWIKCSVKNGRAGNSHKCNQKQNKKINSKSLKEFSYFIFVRILSKWNNEGTRNVTSLIQKKKYGEKEVSLYISYRTKCTPGKRCWDDSLHAAKRGLL